MRTLLSAVPVIFALLGGTVLGERQDSDRVSAETQALLDAHAGVRIHTEGPDVLAIYGVPMTSADTPERAARWWIEDHAATLGVDNVDLRLSRSNDIGTDGRFSVFVYAQYMDNLPVDFGYARVLVLKGSPNHVVFVGARLAQNPTDGFGADSITGAEALASVQTNPEYSRLSIWTEPVLVVYYGEGLDDEMRTARTWSFQGTHPELSEFARYTFFVNAADGELEHVRNDVHNVDVEGHLSGMATPGVFPDSNTNAPVEFNVGTAMVEIQGGADTLSDDVGDFVIANDGSSDVTVVGRVTDGLWVTVNNEAGGEITASEVVTPPGPAELLLNDTPSENETAQVNAHIHTTLVHDFYKDRQPGFDGLDIVITANVNINSNCNAFFSGTTINFYTSQGGNGCPNTAYTTVVAHEYGHFVVAAKNLGQGSFGEGFGDAIANMLYNDPGTGHDFFGPGQGPLRTALDVINYPCGGAIHTCGQTLSGVWWQIKLAFDDLMGEEAGLAATQQLFTDWMEMTSGGSGNDSAHPGTAIEVLTMDDDDGDLGNGTPHRGVICDAFSSRNISCPDLADLAFVYPNGLPGDVIDPNVETAILVTVEGIAQDPAPGTGTVSYSIDNGPFTTVPMIELQPNEYEATLPAMECVQGIQYYFSAEDTTGAVHTDPPDAPASVFVSVSAGGAEIVTLVSDDFETDPGWTESGNALTGDWERAVPMGGDTGGPPTDYDGSGSCFVTGTAFNEDVDGGFTTLTSIDYDFSGLTRPQVGYARWFSNSAGPAQHEDIFEVEISNNGGGDWVELETVGPTGSEVDGEWFVKSFDIASYIAITDQFRIRFTASDYGNGSYVEAAIDAFEIFEYDCDSVACEGDANGDGLVDPLDSGFVLARFGCEVGGGDPDCDVADQNGDGLVDPLDVGFILARFGTCE